MSKAGLIIKKELFRVFGDRKMIFSLYIFPVVIVILLYSIMGKLIASMEEDVSDHKSIVTVVNGSELMKGVMDSTGYLSMSETSFITQSDYDANRDNIELDLKNGDMDLIVYMPENFDETVASYVGGDSVLPSIKVYYNSTEEYSQAAYTIFSEAVFESVRTSIQAMKYGDIQLLNAVDMESEIICKEEKKNTQFISMMLPYMIVMMLFAGVMSVGVDAIAGEKERGTLSSMLISPVKRVDIAVGKLVSMAILAGISAVVYVISMTVSMTMMGDTDTLGSMGFGGISFSLTQILELAAIMLTLVFMYVGVIGLIATLCPNTKTASSYISPVYIVIIFAGMSTMFRTGADASTAAYLIPVYGNALAISDLCAMELTTANFLASVGSSIAIGVILIVAIVKAFNSEKLMFNA